MNGAGFWSLSWNLLSALGFDWLFLLGLFRFFFQLELVADDFEDGYLGVVADTVSSVDNAGVAASAIRERLNPALRAASAAE